ncbi:MAG: hypothetical protein GFH27_549445n44 [Chloroflexi bacterium AL-W]|nr:hypothetical protein [Chloroflexi bacterium AL-N1]NOK71700.1 hypothetical protein [Chloroflexi bacterium AL-N10]NOK79041.1 hypothetical protein [Chloroflexi bacterium AL-N5]NOK86475.1 hypothetical protein [Chloroflexi bacterium AL-W]NOK93441.1 hypothetical protein [Chloroflexi bacterium AL-N15]
MPRHRNHQNHSDDLSAEAADVPLQDDADTPAFIQHMVAFRDIQPPMDLKQQLKEQMMEQYVQQSQRHSKDKGRFALFQRPRAIGLGVALALVLLVGASITIPPVRASMVAIYQYMGILFVNTEAMRDTNTSMEVPIVESTPIGLTLEQAQEQVSFHIGVPEKLPEELKLVHISTSEQNVFLKYHPSHNSNTQDTPEILLRIRTDMRSGPFLPDSRREDVQVHQNPAVFVHGGWNDAEQGDPDTIMGDLAWDDSIDTNWLLWEVGDVTYWMETRNMPLSRVEVIEIAESIK